MSLFHKLYRTVFVSLLFAIRVHAVYSDEAFQSDWQWTNIGDYRCVLGKGNDSLTILSDLDGRSLLSFVNSTNGDVILRQRLEFHVEDIMSLDGGSKLALKTNDEIRVLDAGMGVIVDSEVESFESSCIVDLSKVAIENNAVKIFGNGLTNAAVFEVPLPQGFREIKYLETDNLDNLSIMFSTEDDIYYYREFTDGEFYTSWVRDESASTIVAYTYISEIDDDTNNVYEELNTESTLNIFQAYWYRLNQNWRRLLKFLKNTNKTPGSIVTHMLKDDDEDDLWRRDLEFGQIKSLILATGAGNIIAIDMKTGDKQWSLPTGVSGITGLEAVKGDTELILFTKEGIVAKVDITNHQAPIINSERIHIPNEKVFRLGDSDDFFFQAPKPTLLLAEKSSNLDNTIIVGHDKKSLAAYSVTNGELFKTWKIHVEPEEEVVAFASRYDEVIMNIGKVLGNRSVMYKYLNPNLASYIVANKKANYMTVNIIDTVTGELIHSVYHDEGIVLDEPINLVFGEHWVIYSYFSNVPIAEQRISVIELYESSQPNVRTSNSSVVQDSLRNSHKPHVISQSFFYPEVIKHMLLSRTKYGVTTKAIILELENGQITYLPKFILNARRVEASKMSESDKREFMAMPYISNIPLDDKLVLTHSRMMINGKSSKLISIPTNLESTSFLCSLSHDIFCTRIAPSSQFDTLSPSFEKGKLLATIVAIITVCYFLNPIAETKKLKTKWLVKDFSY
ncbi:HCL658Cp [Eremothecium sinecaudum]|uniref:ER membrane protein complex subunit 1 n=1 Tax=Eremothecium sinecaudum TaxID=45286 RepID=A0A109UXX5_9SACH|nr:HCL658Cp [Eremothecium sinecaudum]AMD19493.1 HCL658Cp [Eremothecium sinecaudum]